VLLLCVYRSLPALLAHARTGRLRRLAGVAAVALGFDAVHGITLGFGVTLIGEAVDYSIYLFIQGAVHWRHAVWPTIRLGVLTSICGSPRSCRPRFWPAQLGLYSVTGSWRRRCHALRAPGGCRAASRRDRARRSNVWPRAVQN